MIKLLATDLDGTLFYPRRPIGLMIHKNKKFLRDFILAGGQVIIITGRSIRTYRKVEQKLKRDVAFLGCSGSILMENDKVLASHPIDRNALMKLYMTTRSEFGIIGWLIYDDTDVIKIAPTNMGKALSIGAVIVNTAMGAYKEVYQISETKFVQTIAHHPVYKILPCFGITPKSARKRAELGEVAVKEMFGDSMQISLGSPFLEITGKGVTKASTLKEYLSLKGIRDDEVIVCGDSFNDLEVFEQFQNSFAMKSGEKTLKNKARGLINHVSDLRKIVLDEDGKLRKEIGTELDRKG